MNTARPNLSGAFTNNRPNLSQINKILARNNQKIKKTISNNHSTNSKVGDFLCISLILGVICYFIFFGNQLKKNKKDNQMKEKLEQIKNLNYNYFKS